MTDLSTLTHENFAACLHQRFTIDSGDENGIAAELVEAQTRGAIDPDSGGRQRFSVVFRGPMEPVLIQQIYRVGHDGLGELELFLVPIGPDGDGMLYEAVFS